MGFAGFHIARVGPGLQDGHGTAEVVRLRVEGARGRSDSVADVPPSAADLAMDRYARGEDAAFGELYDLIAPRLLGYLTRQTRDPARAEDLVQQTLLRIHRARGRFLAGGAVLPWAMAIARRLLIDDLRHRRGDHASRSLDDEPNLEPPDPAPTAVDLVVASQLLARVRRALAKLPDSQREAFELIKEDGLSLAEAADVLGTTVTAVKLRAHRAYVALREALGDLAPDLPSERGARS
jgi:RNA polymerase sigma-70 factor (ECF subfamily)